MSETKRRIKSEEAQGHDGNGGQPPRRQTRVTLTKDVSSKYRKIMPKDQPNKKTGAKTSRRGPADEGSKSPARPPRSGRKAEGAERYESGREHRPPRSGRKTEGAERYESDRERRPAPAMRRSSEAGSFGGPRRAVAGSRKTDGRPTGRRPASPAAARRPGPEVALRAIVNRELPEASRQIKETQELILNSANEMLNLTEVLESIHQRLGEAVDGVLDEHAHLRQLLTPLRDETAKAQNVVVGLYEKMSFQDLAGQRLLKVEGFLAALGQVLDGIGGKAAPRSKPVPAGRDSAKPVRKAAGDKLKGPQARGEGMAQDDVDQILAGL